MSQAQVFSSMDADLDALLFNAVSKPGASVPDKAANAMPPKMMNSLVKTVTTTKMSPEQVKEHQVLMTQLCNYGSSPRFSKYLLDQGFALTQQALKPQSTEVLEDMLIRVKTTINTKTSGSFWKDFVETGAGIIEYMTVSNEKVKEYCDLTGYAKAVSGNEDIMDTIEQIRLDNQSVLDMGPEKRLLVLMAKTGLTVRNINVMTKATNNIISSSKIDPEKLEAARKMVGALTSKVDTALTTAVNNVVTNTIEAIANPPPEPVSYSLTPPPPPAKIEVIEFPDYETKSNPPTPKHAGEHKSPIPKSPPKIIMPKRAPKISIPKVVVPKQQPIEF
jgi:hypothetical protein